jgi:hypothetical protein
MSLISRPVLAPAFSGAPVALDRPARYGDGPIVRAKAKTRPEADLADAPVTRADLDRIEVKLSAILTAVEALGVRLEP